MLASSRAPGPLKAVSGMMSSTTGAPNSFSSHAIKAGAFLSFLQGKTQTVSDWKACNFLLLFVGQRRASSFAVNDAFDESLSVTHIQVSDIELLIEVSTYSEQLHTWTQ